jgi:hypothetical protein
MASWFAMPCLATAEVQNTRLPPPLLEGFIIVLTLAFSTAKEESRLMRSVSSNSCRLVVCAAAGGGREPGGQVVR